MRQQARQRDRIKQLALSKISTSTPHCLDGCLGVVRQAQATSQGEISKVSRVSRVLGGETARQDFQALLNQVGAKVVHVDGMPVLRFEPHLDGPQVDPERWTMAEVLEDMFWKYVTNYYD